MARAPHSSASECSRKSNGRRAPWRAAGCRNLQGATSDREIGSRRDDIKVVALDQHAILGLPHGHRRVAGQQIHHHAFVGRVEMLDQDKCHAVAGWQCAYKLPAGIEAAGRGANSDNRKRWSRAYGTVRGRGTAARSRSDRFGPMRTAFWHPENVLKSLLPHGKRQVIISQHLGSRSARTPI